MKKFAAFLVCALLLVMTMAGCVTQGGAEGAGKDTADAAVNEALLGCFGKSADEAVKALGLKDDQKAGDYGYTLDYAWGGQTMETNFATNYGGAGVFGYAEAQKMFENSDAGTAEIKAFVEKFTAQFNDPYAVTRYTQAEKTKETYDAAQLETYLKDVAGGESGSGVQLRFSLAGENDRMSDDGDYIEVSVQNTGDGLRVKLSMEHVNR
ncbi:MAG: hypothetical protein PUH05_02635 [Firmicutes bacterium]|uniref:hypothetical protein n=1 Tax=Hominenteromicrobium sp. TaxID=3073581 RepID=UPI002A54407B|nr:hypothetical protein [Bacillota bacterium]